MAALLHFQFRPLEGNPYQNPWLTLVKKHHPTWPCYDLDGESDEVSVHYAKQFVQEASTLWVSVAHSEEISKPELASAVLRPLVRNRPTFLGVLTEGPIPGLERLFNGLKPNVLGYGGVDDWLERLEADT